jgi:hypothetical protein
MGSFPSSTVSPLRLAGSVPTGRAKHALLRNRRRPSEHVAGRFLYQPDAVRLLADEVAAATCWSSPADPRCSLLKPFLQHQRLTYM